MHFWLCACLDGEMVRVGEMIRNGELVRGGEIIWDSELVRDGAVVRDGDTRDLLLLCGPKGPANV